MYYLSNLFGAYVESMNASTSNSFLIEFLKHFSQNILGLERIHSKVTQHSNTYNSKKSVGDVPKNPQASQPSSGCLDSPAPVQRITILFDLDETLSHCTDELAANNMTDNPLPINIRPHAKEVLRNLKNHVDLGLFTSSQIEYADRVLDQIDPDGNLFSFRLYRNSCVEVSEGVYVKDLRVLSDHCSINRVFLVDNNQYCSAMNLQNYIPILEFTENFCDDQLLHLQQYILTLSQQSQPLKFNSNYFGHDLLTKYLFNVSIIPQMILSRIIAHSNQKV